MPVSKKRKKNEKRRHREIPAAPPGAPVEPAPSGGFLGRMRSGLRNVAGVGAPKKESPLSKILTWALVLAVAYFAARRLGIIP